MVKYEPLTEMLRDAAARGQDAVDLGIDKVGQLVGGLPASADGRQWWANSSSCQALAWRAAGFHVEQVALDRRQVRFARGERGGTYEDRGRIATSPTTRRAAPRADLVPIGEPVDVRVRLQWVDAGVVKLDAVGKPTFGVLESKPGLYRMSLNGGVAAGPGRSRIYIGETENLRRRLSSNYRNPGPRQKTSIRINALLREHLAAGGIVTVAVATTAAVWLEGVEHPLNLTRKAGRLLAENAALVLAQVTDDATIVNIG